MRRLSRERANLKKVSGYAIFINGLQALAALAVALLSLFFGDTLFDGMVEQTALGTMALIVVWGAVLDVRDALSARKIESESNMLEEAIGKLSELNGTLRAQRHDFMNHLQVVYGLMEMREYRDAQDYIETVYSDIQKVNQSLKTSIPAVNALLASKLADCDARGIEIHLIVNSPWQGIPVSDWILCRILGNLIDNALEALSGRPLPALRICLEETIHAYTFEVSNNGPAIPSEIKDRIFQQGFSTKGEGRGTGLAIVSDLLREYGGTLSVRSDVSETQFAGSLPKPMPARIFS